MTRDELNGVHWAGKPILDMAKDELLDVVAHLLTLTQDQAARQERLYGLREKFRELKGRI